MSAFNTLKEILDELPLLDIRTENDNVIIDSNIAFDIIINGKRLGSFRVANGCIHIVLHTDKFKGMVWIATDRKVDEKKSSIGQRWVDLV